MLTFDKLMKQVTKYGNNVVKILQKKKPDAVFSMQDITRGIAYGLSPDETARIIILFHESSHSQTH